MKAQNWKTRLLTSSVFAGAVFAAAALPATAQEDDAVVTTDTAAAEQPDSEARQQKITVTGSRLALQDFQAISPVTTVGSEAIELNATLTIETLLNELPQVIPGNTVTSNNAGGEDFATIDLRGLGPQRTLVLVDGERVAGSSATGVVDLNAIPAGLIDRIEVVTGGASAVYGSDAIAGVVNFILKDDFEGAQLTFGGGGAFDGNAQYETMDLLMGGNFDSGRGNAVAYASYFNRDGVLQGAYDYSRVSAAVVYGYDSATSSYVGNYVVDTLDEFLAARAQLAADFPTAGIFTFPGGSATPPWGFVSNSASNPFTALNTNPGTPNFAAVDADCNPSTAPVGQTGSGGLSFNDQGQLTPRLAGGACAIPLRDAGSSRYNFAPDNYIFLPAERYGIQTFINYDVTESIRMKTMLSYVRSIAQVQLAPTPITGLSIPVSSPAIAGADGIVGTADDPHSDLSAALNSRPTPGANFTYAWRSSGVGPRVGDFVNSNLNARVSFTGDLFEGWEWNLSGGWGQVNASQGLRNNVNTVALLQGIAGCANLPASSLLPNCVNVDIFGPASIVTDQAASFIRTDVQANSTIEQTSLSGYVRGDLFKLPAGSVAAVVGLEYRQDDINLKVDDAQRRGEIAGFNAVQDIQGQLDVYEGYGEISVPILADLPFAQELSVDAGFRVSDYSTIGSVESYKYGARYSPTDWLRFRAVYNKAVRAPSALESFQNGDQGFPGYIDPCRATVTTPAGAAALLAFCTTPGGIGAGFVPASVAPSFAANNSQVQAFAFGNPNLEPEQGETITAGFVFEPDFLPAGTFRSTVDYFDITLTDAIVARGAQTILNSCYGGLGGTAQSAFDCQQIVRDPATGQVTSVNTTLTNSLGETQIKGWDVQADYEIDLDEMFSGAPGTFGLNVLLTLTDEYLINGTDIVGTTDAGIGGATPDFKSVTTVDYRLDDWTFQLRHNYVPSLEGNFFGPPDTPELSNFDGSVAWDVNDRFRVVAGVSNLTDEFPPQTATGVVDQGNTDAALYAPWVVGRTFSLQGRIKF